MSVQPHFRPGGAVRAFDRALPQQLVRAMWAAAPAVRTSRTNTKRRQANVRYTRFF